MLVNFFFVITTTVSRETTQKPTPLKAASLKTRLFTTPAKNIGQGESKTQMCVNVCICTYMYICNV